MNNYSNLPYRTTILLFIIILISCFIPTTTSATSPPKIKASAYVLMDYETGTLLLEGNSNQALPPASMTKMMTQYIVLEKIKEGQLAWDEVVTIDHDAALLNRGGASGVHLQAGEQRTVKELFMAMSVFSANDAASSLAIHVAGDETTFVKWMNLKAQELGLTKTHYRNSTGLPPDFYRRPPVVSGKHQMSARDVAHLARQLIHDYPEILSYSAIPKMRFRPGEVKALTLKNTNWMLQGAPYEYTGVDGLKTGFTAEAGYCFTGTIKHKDLRFITVVMGTDTNRARFAQTATLLDYGLKEFQLHEFIRKEHPLPHHQQISIKAGVEEEVTIVPSKTIRLPVRSTERDRYTIKVDYQKNLYAPLPAQTEVATATLYYDGQPVPNVSEVPLVTTERLERADALILWKRSFEQWHAHYTPPIYLFPLIGISLVAMILGLIYFLRKQR
ncbi:D-alanyl-D-alanine carboxypeptidase family protein [Mechercharimyces sp. CAU 1602]|uniref:D-alanyl-D-alanine carboxypeptidase family protein n=1 Tax=Mechercharimyces sp. CAU 1602 TaxID=2973933 RepID=UPI0021611FC3|nr:D-alanyl-D-alanine carboxypeptidase family protein [Mechercharimyces sp. CAU 1602]MCS1352679.1 D-alanyl-D-alanine carboxypeptidase [Mechercharimyces sp. CAU 1602]